MAVAIAIDPLGTAFRPLAHLTLAHLTTRDVGEVLERTRDRCSVSG